MIDAEYLRTADEDGMKDIKGLAVLELRTGCLVRWKRIRTRWGGLYIANLSAQSRRAGATAQSRYRGICSGVGSQSWGLDVECAAVLSIVLMADCARRASYRRAWGVPGYLHEVPRSRGANEWHIACLGNSRARWRQATFALAVGKKASALHFAHGGAQKKPATSVAIGHTFQDTTVLRWCPTLRTHTSFSCFV